MRRIFVDSTYHLAVFNENDVDHLRAITIGRDLASIRGVEFITTETVLMEVLAFVSRMGPKVRREAVNYVQRVRTGMTGDPTHDGTVRG